MRSLQDKAKQNQLSKAIQELDLDEESLKLLPSKYQNALIGGKTESQDLHLERLYGKIIRLKCVNLYKCRRDL